MRKPKKGIQSLVSRVWQGFFFFLNEGRDTKYPFEGIIAAARGTRYWVLGTEY